jgi:hypothetical protein
MRRSPLANVSKIRTRAESLYAAAVEMLDESEGGSEDSILVAASLIAASCQIEIDAVRKEIMYIRQMLEEIHNGGLE